MTRHTQGRRGGFSIIAVLALFVLAGSLFTVWARDALQQHEQTQLAHQRVQAEWLAASALSRAAAGHAADPQYDGELWELTPGELGQPYAAEVTITLDAEAEPKQVTAVVRLSTGAQRRLQVTRAAELAAPPAGNQPSDTLSPDPQSPDPQSGES